MLVRGFSSATFTRMRRPSTSFPLSVAIAASAEFGDAELLAGATVHPWLTVARLKMQDGRTHRMLVVADTMNSEDFRRLRVFLRWRAEFSAPAGDV